MANYDEWYRQTKLLIDLLYFYFNGIDDDDFYSQFQVISKKVGKRLKCSVAHDYLYLYGIIEIDNSALYIHRLYNLYDLLERRFIERKNNKKGVKKVEDFPPIDPDGQNLYFDEEVD